MNKNQLVFGSDCVINFDDLGEFKDYTDDIENMAKNMEQIKNNQTTEFNETLLRQILKADPQDTFHAPAFTNLISIAIDILMGRKQFFKAKPNLHKLLFHNLMQILQQSFVSYQFSQQIGPKLCSYLIDQGKRKDFNSFQKMQLLLCISKLTKKISYIDQLDRFSQLIFYCINQQQIVLQKDASIQWTKMMLDVYAEVIELITRNKKVRVFMSKKIKEQSMLMLDHLFLGYKISLWEKDDNKANLYLKRMQAELLTNYQVLKLAAKKLS